MVFEMLDLNILPEESVLHEESIILHAYSSNRELLVTGRGDRS